MKVKMTLSEVFDLLDKDYNGAVMVAEVFRSSAIQEPVIVMQGTEGPTYWEKGRRYPTSKKEGTWFVLRAEGVEVPVPPGAYWFIITKTYTRPRPALS